MQAAPGETGCRELGRGVAFPGNINTAAPFPGPCTHSQPGLCSGKVSVKHYRWGRKKNMISKPMMMKLEHPNQDTDDCRSPRCCDTLVPYEVKDVLDYWVAVLDRGGHAGLFYRST